MDSETFHAIGHLYFPFGRVLQSGNAHSLIERTPFAIQADSLRYSSGLPSLVEYRTNRHQNSPKRKPLVRGVSKYSMREN